MKDSTILRPSQWLPTIAAIGVAVLVSILATGCGEGARPTLTGDPLVETAAATPDLTTTDLTPTDPTLDPATPDLATTDPAGPSAEAQGGVEQMVVEVIESFPHDPSAFTQGLELHDGVFIESTGLYGESELRRVSPQTGEVMHRVAIPDEYFAEGVTRVGDQLIQLTWQENTAFYWDLDTFERTKDVAYTGEGWGICYDGSRLIMTDGTPVLIFRDPATFDEIGRVPVTIDGEDVFNLNEVECVDGVVWANIWQTDLIVRIDPLSGNVTGVVDAAALDAPTEPSGAVLNGIAWDDSTQSFYVTGKLWPTMYRVNFVPAATS